MYELHIFLIITAVFIIHTSTGMNGVCVNVSNSPLECCPNYRVVGNSCEAMKSVEASQNPGICSNLSNREPLECCPNYRIVGTSCEECWPGSRGVHCAEDCAPGFYGRLCREECACDPCDKVKGCLDITQEYINNKTMEQKSSSTRLHLPTILTMSLGCFAICFIVCLTVGCICRFDQTTRTTYVIQHGNHTDGTLL
ncbi:scavenger receptor class F member 1-like [Magallana gigas]|uniref:scavenger receptor class F member 1-like n=1 Tax=Magallana gigas TaxID=29159 RepID=UPI003340B5C1